MRVVLLARAGDACDRLRDALGDLGAELALVADPMSADPGDVAAARPQAVLVALEPAIEDALERFDALLTDPDITVIFDEAELAAQRAGWDAARWVRHLSAKLNRHHDVLPPGSEAEGDLHPSPGPLPSARDPDELDIASFADEAQELAAEVPRDEGASEGAWSGEELVDIDTLFASMSGDDDGKDGEDAVGAGAFEPDAIEAIASDDPDDDAMDFESISLDDPTDAPGSPTLPDDGAGDEAVREIESTLTLADDDAPISAAAGSDASAPAVDLDALDQRAASLSLADVDSYGHGPLRGAVLVEAGLGGPDAVRQLLAAFPEGFPRPVLVRLHLDGGRYDRLVKQMERASTLPVALAKAGQAVEPGTAYFLPPSVAVERDRNRLRFVDAEDDAQSTLVALPGNDSAVLLLSGSDSGIVDAVMELAADGALVAGQAPDSCYDAAAATALIARGAIAGAPAELVERLLERWPV